MYDSLLQHAREQGDNVALIDEVGQHTWRDLALRSEAVRQLVARITTRRNVGILLPSGSAFFMSYFGTLMAGRVAVPINFLLGEKELAHIIADSGIDVILSAGPLMQKFAGLPCRMIDVTAEIQAATELPADVPPPARDRIAVLLYTSGTSALPKGVMLSFGNFLSDADACIVHAELKRRHHFLGVLPMFHAFGMTTMLVCPVRLGALTVYLQRFTPMAALEAIRKHKVTILFAVPSILAALAQAKSAASEDFAGMDYIISGGEPLPPTLVALYRERFGADIFEGYGMTETSPVLAMNTPRFSRAGSVGKAIPGAEFRIVDEEDRALPVGTIGEILVRGPMVMKGYHNLPAQTSAVLLPDGFLRTGDLGRLDEEGFLIITGRKKDMIIIAGEKVYPREIEDTLAKHPAIAEASIVGVSSGRRGEMIVAFIHLREGMAASAEELRKFCLDGGLPNWKCPREFRFLDSLPRSPTGKVLKRELAKMVE